MIILSDSKAPTVQSTVKVNKPGFGDHGLQGIIQESPYRNGVPQNPTRCLIKWDSRIEGNRVRWEQVYIT